MTPEERLASEDPQAHACFVRVRALLAKRAEWRPEFAIGLEPVAEQCAFYLHEARTLCTVADPELQKELAAYTEELRMTAREALVEFAVLDPELSRFAALDREGLDATISRLCAPLDPD